MITDIAKSSSPLPKSVVTTPPTPKELSRVPGCDQIFPTVQKIKIITLNELAIVYFFSILKVLVSFWFEMVTKYNPDEPSICTEITSDKIFVELKIILPTISYTSILTSSSTFELLMLIVPEVGFG